MARSHTGLDQLPSGRWRARVVHERKQISIGTFDTRTDAKAALAIAHSEQARQIFVPPAQRRAEAKARKITEAKAEVTVDDVAKKFFTHLETTGKARGTTYTYKSRYRSHIAPAFGTRPITAVTVADIEDWYATLLGGHGHGVARSAYLTISSLFNYAAGKAAGQTSSFKPYIDSSPVIVSGASKHRPERRETEPVATIEQVAYIADHVPERVRLAILLAAWAAPRLGELIALQRGDIDTTGDVYWLSITRQVQARGEGLYETDPKSEAGIRTVPIPAALNRDVKEHLREIPRAKTSLLFPRREGGWMHPNTLRGHFNRAVVAWNREYRSDRLDDFTFHGLRHTALTRIGQAHATLEELKRYAGHSSAEVVSRYQHATRDRLAMLAGALSETIGES